MQLLSTSFQQGGMIPEIYTCKGTNINPELHWQDVPSKTKSFCLLMDEPDAPIGDWVHWIVFNISATSRALIENAKPAGAMEGVNSWKKNSYGGPCPPSGIHRYFFKLFALDIMLDAKKSYDKNNLLSTIKNHVLDQAELMGKFKK